MKSILLVFSVFWYILVNQRLVPLDVSELYLHVYAIIPIISCCLYNRESKSQGTYSYLVASFVFIFLFQLFCNRSYFWVCVEMLLLPWFLLRYSGVNRVNSPKVLLLAFLFLYLFNLYISAQEYLTKSYIYNELDNIAGRFRACGIWGHPLYSALITGYMMLLIIQCKLNKLLKIVLYTMGVLVIFMYDARAAIIMVLLSSAGILFFRGFLSSRNFVYIVIIIFGIGFAFNYLSENELGGKIFASETIMFKDGSSAMRLLAFEIFFSQDIGTMIRGVTDIKEFTFANGVNYIENSLIYLMLQLGLIPGILAFYMSSKAIFDKWDGEKCVKMCMLIYVLTTGVVSQALSTSYMWVYFLLIYLLIQPNLIEDATARTE